MNKWILVVWDISIQTVTELVILSTFNYTSIAALNMFDGCEYSQFKWDFLTNILNAIYTVNQYLEINVSKLFVFECFLTTFLLFVSLDQRESLVFVC